MLTKIQQRLKLMAGRSSVTIFLAAVIAMSNVGVAPPVQANHQPPGEVGSGFIVTAADLQFILQQIKISENHAVSMTETDICAGLLGNGPNQISSPLLSFGLRTVDGSCNNLETGQAKFGSADQTFPRLTTPTFNKPADDSNVPGIGPVGPPGITNYNQTVTNVVDSRPRQISNLIVDQTSTNPSAVHVAGFPPRTQGNPGVEPCTSDPSPTDPDGTPDGCVPSFQTLFIPNVTTDVGLSPPFNSLFTIFGQFFDHGLDKITNGGNGVVFVPLKDDDPLIAGPDHDVNTVGDNLPENQRFMTLSRGKIVNDPVTGIRNAKNTDTPFVDQSQTYSSHAAHQVFLREYTLVDHDNDVNTPERPMSTGKFLSETGATAGTLATWASIKLQAAEKLGLALQDQDIHDIPMLATDPYGNFIPGPDRGLPQFVVGTTLVEGNIALPVPTPGTVTRIGAAFLDDLAPASNPGTPTNPKIPDGLPGDNDGPQDHFAQPSATEYDNELLNQHFICGDGRCNENIALTAVHQVFHAEHDRLAVEFDLTTLPNGPSSFGNASLKADYQATNCPIGCATNNPGQPITFTYGQRLFQAARFVTEMQYQHLVFEDFARKVQPLINPFTPFAFNQTDVNSAITAEFAHAVYRFGHSMLNDTVPRVYPDKSKAPIDLFDAFLNPGEFNNSPAGTLNASQATGAIIMGLSDQVGNEIDEFVADTLRNRLLGRPVDLAALNMTRARSEGVPSLNGVRKQIHAATNEAALAPYGNWFDFGENIKNPTSLINFIAAYGKHPNITGLDPDGSGPIVAGSVQARRMAADQILNNTILPGPNGAVDDDPLTVCNAPNDPVGCDEAADNIFAPTDSAEFIFSIASWANVAGASITGLDDVDLWVGGLAEKTELFGGILGSTFNYVFEKQLTDLQNGDRFYYLARTPGMNLRSQLEGNSFSELVMRNSNAHTLKADAFATADCKFELENLAGTAADFIALGQNVADDPDTECDESALLVRLPDGTIKYRTNNTVDAPGINGQGVYRGADNAVVDFVDRIYGGVDNDTFWGGLGNDIIDGGGGDDVVLGGEGDDIITDFAGADFLKGGPGNDAIDGGPGDDIIAASSGQDFTNGGQNLNETFSGPDNDFAIAGKGKDAVFGDSGDDWQEGDDQPDLLIGDSSTLFFDDHNLPGHDILIGQGGDDDYDMEGGDDIGVTGPGVEKDAGAAGFDWAIGLGDKGAPSATNPNGVPFPQNLDLNLPIIDAPPANETRDRFNEVEALSGWDANDTLRGDSIVPSQVGGGGFIGCDALDADGVARIAGLETLVPASIRTVDPAATIALAVTNHCGLEGPIWGEGNILLGGAGSDTFEGRGADDIIDGDRYLNVRLSVRQGIDVNGFATGPEIGSTNLMTGLPVTGNFGPDTAGMNLQAAVFAGKVNPGQIVAVREILAAPVLPTDCGAATPLNCDTAVFTGLRTDYTLAFNGDILTVTDNGPVPPAPARPNDGIDTLRNIERLDFCATFDAAGVCTARATVSVTPLAVATPNSLAFGNQIVNTASAIIPFTVTNTGLLPLIISSVGVNPTGEFSVTSTTCTAAPANTTGLTTGTSCTVNVQFTPTSVANNKAADVIIAHNGIGSPTRVGLTGNGMPVPPPVAATRLRLANLTGNNQVRVDWVNPVASTATSISVDRCPGACTAASTFTEVASLPATSTTFTNVGVTPAGAYTYRVREINTGGATPSAVSTVTLNNNATAAPSVLVATAGGTGVRPVTVTYNDNTASETGFVIQWAATTAFLAPATITSPPGANVNSFVINQANSSATALVRGLWNTLGQRCIRVRTATGTAFSNAVCLTP